MYAGVHRKEVKLKKVIRVWGLVYHCIKGKRFRFQRTINCGPVTAKCLPLVFPMRVILVGSVDANSAQCQLLVSGDHLFFPFWHWGGTFTKGNLCPAFRQIRGMRRNPLPASVTSQLPSAQNNLYAKMAYFDVAYSGTPLARK